MTRAPLLPLLGTLTAIAVTTAMDATGLSVFSALPLFPLMALFWYVERLSRTEIGFVWGTRSDYRAAILHPLLVLSAATLAVVLARATDLADTNWQHFWLNLIAGGLTTILVTAITEEGFFRGWLWASLEKRGFGKGHILIVTSVAFTLWHVSAVSLDTGFDLPAAQIPVYLVNATLIGLIWGMLRLASGSVLVPSVAHGVWNGAAYALFAFGEKVGALGVTETSIWGPEVGFVGVGLNALFALGCWRWLRSRRAVVQPVVGK